MNRRIAFSFIAIYCLAAGLGFFLSGDSATEDAQPASYILQGKSTQAVVDAVDAVNGQITHEFRMINAVAATLTLEQHDDLLVNPAIIAINEDAPVKTASRVKALTASVGSVDSAAPAIADL